MKRRAVFLMLAAALASTGALAERVERKDARMAGKVAPAEFTEEARQAVRSFIRARKAMASARAAAQGRRAALFPLPAHMAPGVVQINLFDSAREAYFTVTERIPPDSLLQAFIIPPDLSQEWALEALRTEAELLPGDYLTLPAIRAHGDFWQQGLTTYVVYVSTGGRDSVTLFDFPTNHYYRDQRDVDDMVPGIYWWRQFWSGDNHWLEIKGRFLTDTKTYVAFEDLVAPEDAIEVADNETIFVNLSRIRGFDLSRMQGFLLTVGQDRWSDVVPFRFAPIR